jgi:hypothetical protein
MMPEFVLEGRDHAARAESDFILGFIEALFFTETGHVDSDDWHATDSEERESDGALPSDAGYTDLHPDSLAAIRADCEKWQTANAALLSEAYETGYDESQAGRDYWFTRNGHGVGFWDREELNGVTDSEGETIGARLTTACQYNELNPYFHDDSEYGPCVFVDL